MTYLSQPAQFSLLSKDDLILAVVEQIYDDYDNSQGRAALVELLQTVGVNRLVDYLPEESGVKLVQAQTIIKETSHVNQD
ncbi:MAG: hypothetical protein VW715_02265 [Rhodospirillales bacterium]|jgi:hypothetical protein